MEVPLLGKMYAYDLLKILEGEKYTFTGLLKTIKISHTTLSKTLQALVLEGYVEKESIGKYSIYRITGKGVETLKPKTQIRDILLEGLTDYVLKRLAEEGVLEQIEVDRKELHEYVQKHAPGLLQEIVDNVKKDVKAGLWV